jgi:predicted nucleic acid-binding protein
LNAIVLDANALISFVTDRAPAQQAEVAKLFERAARAEAALLCPQNVLTEFVYVMSRVYRVEPRVIARMIGDLIELPGVEVVHDLDYPRLFALWPSRIPEYGDAIVAAVCQSHKGSGVITFDKKLRRRLRRTRVPLATAG